MCARVRACVCVCVCVCVRVCVCVCVCVCVSTEGRDTSHHGSWMKISSRSRCSLILPFMQCSMCIRYFTRRNKGVRQPDGGHGRGLTTPNPKPQSTNPDPGGRSTRSTPHPHSSFSTPGTAGHSHPTAGAQQGWGLTSHGPPAPSASWYSPACNKT